MCTFALSINQKRAATLIRRKDYEKQFKQSVVPRIKS